VPWCADCDRYLSVPTVRADGTCPRCGNPVESPLRVDASDEADTDERVALPWHLWLLLAALAVYLGFRFWQGIEWLWSAVA